ncbi:cytochrome B [Aliifodinibius salicampi]|uniref:Cytochrome B n=1 Tax=Fodinibius salicampi TaxID=1920655 RepID=A0ABT3PXH8_9BACT|nr:cytochrome B [Fodinibius salicampi]MCW9712560.1 cytochrome B [Fodinibius salicampi]
MYIGFQHLHSYIAYIVLAVLLGVFFYTLINFINKKTFTESARKISLAGLIAAHIQLLIGLVLYFISPMGISNFSGEAMGDAMSRLYMLEHPLTMIIGIILITVGYSKAKNGKDDAGRYKKILIYYGLGIFLILLRIPWSVWP